MRSVKQLAILATLFSASAAQAQSLFSEDFEAGNGAWHAVDDGPIVIATDTDTCSTSYQHETLNFGGGRVIGNAMVPMMPGADFCVSAWIRGSVGGSPFLGIMSYDADNNPTGSVWLMGDPTVESVVAPVTADGTWHWYAAPFTSDFMTTSVTIVDELYAGDSADFDDIQVSLGPCDVAYTGLDQHQVCGGDSPVCSPDGSCQAAAPADMSDAPADLATSSPADLATSSPADLATSSPADMGAAGPGDMSRSPGSPSPDMTTSPITAQGGPTGAGPVNKPAGCSIGDDANALPLGTMMLAMVGVALLLRRRRA